MRLPLVLQRVAYQVILHGPQWLALPIAAAFTFKERRK